MDEKIKKPKEEQKKNKREQSIYLTPLFYVSPFLCLLRYLLISFIPYFCPAAYVPIPSPLQLRL
jgi:hypothetical protein